MDKARAKRLAQKYGRDAAQQKPGMRVGGGPGRMGPAAMAAKGKPKDMKRTIGRLIRYLGVERGRIVAATVCALTFTVTSLASSYMLRPIINRYIEAGDLAGLAVGLAEMAAVYGLSIAAQWIQSRLMLSVSQRTLRRMRTELYDKLQTLPIRFFDKNAVGDIMSRFTNDIDTIGGLLNTTLIQLASGIVTILGTIVVMVYTNVWLALITIVMTPLLMLVSKMILKHSREPYSKQQRALGTLNGFAEEIINGQKVVKVFGHEQVAEEEFAYLNDALCQNQIRAQFLSSIMGPVTHNLCNLTYALTACVGGVLVITRGFDIGGLTIAVNNTRHFNRPINEISMQMNVVFAALAGAERVFEVMDEVPETEETETVPMEKIEGRVELSHVDFGYTPEVPVLHDITLHANPGQKIAFVGSTGAGKTTVTNLLSRFYEIGGGSITVDGVPIERISRPFLRGNIAMVLQDTHLFTGTVRENIRYGRLDATDQEVEAAAKAASAHTFIMNLEHGYDTVLTHDGANLSQGQRQLLNIARAAVSRAPILILDEATSSVDTRTEQHIERGMDALMESRTTFVIAHRLSTVRKADMILVLEHGRIIERGNHEELLAQNGRYADLYHEIAQLD